MLLEADVEPDRTVEGGLLIDEQVFQVVAERLEVVVAREVALLLRPGSNGVDDTANQLFDAPLAVRSADDAAEILGNNDIGRLLRPESRDFHIALLEDNRSLFIADDGRAHLPLNLVERVNPFASEETLVLEPGHGRHFCRRAGNGGLRAGRFDRPPRVQTRGSRDAFFH